MRERNHLHHPANLEGGINTKNQKVGKRKGEGNVRVRGNRTGRYK